MKRTQFEPLVIHDFEEKDFHLPAHGHTYYELVYIWKGTGVHLLNNNRLFYKSGDLFIIGPGDEHFFEIKKQTHFTFIKFTDSYFAGHKLHQPDAFLFSSPEDIMRNKLLKEIKLEMDEPCISILRNTVQNIVAYNCRKDIASSPLIFYQVLSIFGLIREAAAKMNLRIHNGKSDKKDMISYIHQNIYDPGLMKISHIADYFHISPSYFSSYFRRNFDISYRDYIHQYRLKLIEKRIMVPSLTLKQIAAEFGFTDESHLSNFFKHSKKISPIAFRDSNLQQEG